MHKYLLLTILLTAVVGLGALIDTQSHTPAVHSSTVAPAEVIYAPGRLEGASPEVELRPWIGGRVETIPVAEGDLVEAGDVLLRLDDRQYRHEQALAWADLSLAIAERQRLQNGPQSTERHEARAMHEARLADLEQAQLAWQRIHKLHADGVVAQQEADNHRTQVALLAAQAAAAKARAELLDAPPRDDELAMAEARIDAAQARLELAEIQLDHTVLKAPHAGQVLQINVEPGELVGPDANESAVIVADTSKFRVRAFVDEIDAPRLRLGQRAEATVDGLPGFTLTGRVAEMRPRMSHKMLTTGAPTERFDTKTREIWLELDPSVVSDRLVCGLLVDVCIDIQSGKGKP
jgi:HlyD family secretion protein